MRPLDYAILILVIAIAITLVVPMFDADCMSDARIGVYEKIVMAVIAMISAYVGAFARDMFDGR